MMFSIPAILCMGFKGLFMHCSDVRSNKVSRQQSMKATLAKLSSSSDEKRGGKNVKKKKKNGGK